MFAWAFAKNSPIWKVVNHSIMQLNEKGSLDQLRTRYEAKPQECPDLMGSPVAWSGCFSAFLVLIAAAGLALTLLLLEHVTHQLLAWHKPISMSPLRQRKSSLLHLMRAAAAKTDHERPKSAKSIEIVE